MSSIKLKKIFVRDKYGLIRGGLILGVLVIFCTYFTLRIVQGNEVELMEERSSDAVSRVVTRFEQLIDNGFSQMKNMAALLESQQASQEAVLEVLRANELFMDAGVYANGELHGASSAATASEGQVAYIHYDAIAPDFKVIAQTDGAIQLRVSMDNLGELATWVDSENVEAVLSSAFDQEYGYAIYNAATGAYLVNHTGFSNGGYYDTLLAINENGSVEALLRNGKAHAYIEGSDGNAGYYIAQQQSGIQPWSIALILPEDLVQDGATGTQMFYIIILAIVLSVVILGCGLFTAHRIHGINVNARRAIDVGERMLNTAAQQARMTLFVYYRRMNGPILCYDGLNLMGNRERGVCLTTLEMIQAGCGLRGDAQESLEERLHDLAPGNTEEFIIHSAAAGGQERVLRFTLNASAEEAHSVICSIWDCTQELISQNRAEEERNYRVSIEPRTMSIWQINVSRNRWHALHLKPGSFMGALSVVKSVWRDYSADMSGIIRSYIHPADYEAFRENMGIDALSDMYRIGRARFSMDYRTCAENQKDCKWHRMTIRLYVNPDSGDLLANLYVFNVDAEKNAELERGNRKRILQQTLTALGGVFYGLYYVDLEKDLCYTAKAQGGQLVSRLSAAYKSTFDTYIEKYVHPEDQDALRNVLSAYTLRKNMVEGSHYMQVEYRHCIGDEYVWTEAIVQPARFENGSIREVVLALRRIKGNRAGRGE